MDSSSEHIPSAEPSPEHEPSSNSSSAKKHSRRTRTRIRIPSDPVAHRLYKRERLLYRLRLVWNWAMGIGVFCLFVYYMLTKLPKN